MIKKTKEFKKKVNFKQNTGITLIALVITIIVLLILAGISISMLSGDNGILQRATDAKTTSIHANVLERMQLEASAFTVDKTTGNYSNSLIDYLKSKSIISDILGEEDKWLINVSTLLGSNQSIGNGTYPNDVYVLEKHSIPTSSMINTKVATTTPIKISATSSTQITYNVLYYGNGTIEPLTLGNLSDDGDLEERLADGEAKLYCDVVYNDSMTEATINVKLLIGGYEYTVQTFDEWFKESNLYGTISEEWLVQKEIELQNLHHRQEKEDERPLRFTDEEIERLNNVKDFSGLMNFYKEVYDIPEGTELPANMYEYMGGAYADSGMSDDEIVFNYFQDLDFTNEYKQYKEMQYELQKGSLKYKHMFSLFDVNHNYAYSVHCGETTTIRASGNGEYIFRVYDERNGSVDINDETKALTKSTVKIEGLEETMN